MLATVWTLYAISLIVVALRIYTQVKVTQQFGIGDIVMMLATVRWAQPMRWKNYLFWTVDWIFAGHLPYLVSESRTWTTLLLPQQFRKGNGLEILVRLGTIWWVHGFWLNLACLTSASNYDFNPRQSLFHDPHASNLWRNTPAQNVSLRHDGTDFDCQPFHQYHDIHAMQEPSHTVGSCRLA